VQDAYPVSGVQPREDAGFGNRFFERRFAKSEARQLFAASL
jgi:hypothetical protein